MGKRLKIIWMIVCVLLLLFIVAPGVSLSAEGKVGIGLEVMQLYDYTTKDTDKRGSIVVLNVSEGSPADQQGIKRGDIILQVGDVTTRRHDFDDIVQNLLKGAPNTEVTVVVWRPCERHKIEFKVKRTQAVD